MDKTDKSKGMVSGKEKSYRGNRFKSYQNGVKTYFFGIGKASTTENDGMGIEGK